MKTGNEEEEKMNSKKLLARLTSDRQLLAIFSGVVLSAIALISVAVTAGIWYL